MNKSFPIIVALSASIMREEVEKYLQYGMIDFLSKPVSTSNFVSILNKYFRKKYVSN
jgi:CheY-like chemotaxis protein